MASKKNRARAAKDAAPRRYKKKTSALVLERVEYVDYKDVDLLSRFMSDRAKIRNRRVSGNDLQQQRDVASAIKIAREMALLPYARRVASQRTRPPRDGRRGEGGDLVVEGIGTDVAIDDELAIDDETAVDDDTAVDDAEGAAEDLDLSANGED
jgi:small subunit ribosomal protein S18